MTMIHYLFLLNVVFCCIVVNRVGKKEYEHLFKYILYAQKHDLELSFPNLSIPFIWESVVDRCTKEVIQLDTVLLPAYDYRQHCYLRIRPDAHKTFHPFKIFESPHTIHNKNIAESHKVHKEVLAVGVPVSSRGIPFIQYVPLLTHLLPSLSQAHTGLHLMISFDEGDYFFDNPFYLQRITNELEQHENMTFEILKFPRFKALNFLWNWMFHRATELGYSFFLQANDDAIISGLSDMLSALQNNSNLVITGPFDAALPHIFTQALVKIRPHAQLTNGTLYPVQYINWGGDLWLTKTWRTASRFIGNVTNTRPHSRKARYQPCR